jgi:hypothetical protein
MLDLSTSTQCYSLAVSQLAVGSHVHANTVILSFMFLKGLTMTSLKSKHVA